MFNSISSQLNNYNAGPKMGSPSHPLSRPSSNYFPVPSHSSPFEQNPHSPVTQPTYQYYQPKSKIGQLNQRIETQKIRRDSLKRKMGFNNPRDGYMSDSQRSHSTTKSHSRKDSQTTYRQQQEQPTYRRNYASNNEFAVTQPILRHQSVWQPTSQQNLLPPNQVASAIARLATGMPPPCPPTVFASHVSGSSRSSNNNQANYYTDYPQHNSNPVPQQQQMVSYPSFRKPDPRQQAIYQHPSEQEMYFDADSRRRDNQRRPETPFTQSPRTFFNYNAAPNFPSQTPYQTQYQTQYQTPFQTNGPILTPGMQPPQIKSPIVFNNANLSNSVSDVFDRNGNAAKYMGLGVIGIVLLLMIYEIIR